MDYRDYGSNGVVPVLITRVIKQSNAMQSHVCLLSVGIIIRIEMASKPTRFIVSGNAMEIDRFGV